MVSRIAEAQNFLDVNGLNDIKLKSKSTNKADKDEALKEVAKQFESLFTQMLLKSMRKAQEVLESDSPFNSQSVKFYRDMHDQQLALELSSNGSLGLAPLIVRQLGGDQENFTPNSVLRSDGVLPINKFNNKSTDKQSPFSFLLDEKRKNLNMPHFAPKIQKSNLALSAENEQEKISTPIFKEAKDFVSAIKESAKQAEKQLGVPFQVIIAQAALETGWGQKIIKTAQGESSNNLFNIKADQRWQGEKTHKETLEFKQGAMVKTLAPFRVYQSLKESVADYTDFLSSSDRYQGALKQASNVEQFLQGLQDAGYATDPKYANKILTTLGKVTDLLSE